MGLFDRFRKKGKPEPSSRGSRSKRGRAKSVRIRPGTDDAAAPSPVETPSIPLEDLPVPPPAALPDVPIELDPIPVDAGAMPPLTPPSAPTAKAPTAGAATKQPAASLRSATNRMGPLTRTGGRRSTRSRQKPIGELLIEAGAISTEQLTRALKMQERGSRGLLGQILVNMGACAPTAIVSAIHRQFRVTDVEIARIDVAPEILEIVPKEKCLEYRLVPFEKIGGLLCVAMANCLNRKAIDDLEETSKLKIKPFNAPWIEIKKAIEKEYAGAAGAAIELPPVAEAAPAGGETAAPDSIFNVTREAKVEGLESLDEEPELVAENERGLAKKHFEARQERRGRRALEQALGEGVDLESFSPDAIEAVPVAEPAGDEGGDEIVTLDVADEVAGEIAVLAVAEVAGDAGGEVVDLPVAAVADGGEASIKVALPPEAPALPEAAVPVAEGPAPAKKLDLGPFPARAIGEAEWNRLSADLEPDPVVAWEHRYASAKVISARRESDN